jgi:phage-related protein
MTPVQLPSSQKPIEFMGSSLKDLSAFPDEVKYVTGFALRAAQGGGKHPDAKPLKGFGGAGVLEVVETFEGSAYRAVYTVKFEGAVYVLDAFEKKSTKGIATPKVDMDRIKGRLRAAEEHYALNYKKRQAG